MRLTIVGCGDAFGSGGRFNTCYLVEGEAGTLALDFGATSLVALKQHGIDPDGIDAVMLSHLHGDHFGGLPFLLLDYQYKCRRERPLSIVGPLGSRERIPRLMEALFAKSPATQWRFPFEIVDLPCRTKHAVLGYEVETFEMVHPSGAPSTGVRVSDGRSVLAFSGDTSWTDSLVDVARGADLLLLECFQYDRPVPYHLDFGTIAAHRASLEAKAVMLTHMGLDMLAHQGDVEAQGYLTARDGLVVDL